MVISNLPNSFMIIDRDISNNTPSISLLNAVSCVNIASWFYLFCLKSTDLV